MSTSHNLKNLENRGKNRIKITKIETNLRKKFKENEAKPLKLKKKCAFGDKFFTIYIENRDIENFVCSYNKLSYSGYISHPNADPTITKIVLESLIQ